MLVDIFYAIFAGLGFVLILYAIAHPRTPRRKRENVRFIDLRTGEAWKPESRIGKKRIM